MGTNAISLNTLLNDEKMYKGATQQQLNCKVTARTKVRTNHFAFDKQSKGFNV